MASPIQQAPARTEGSNVPTWVMVCVAFGVGVAVEIVVAQYGHRREAWDSPLYWQVGWPAMVATGFVCGAIARQRPWLIGYAPFLGNIVAMLARTGGGSMLPLGLILSAIIGAPGVGAAYLGGKVAERFRR